MKRKTCPPASRKINEISHGQPVFERVSGSGPRYISPDADVHRGGVWKGANTLKDLMQRTSKSGTFDANLQWIGR